MDNLKIEGSADTFYTPTVDFCAETGILEIIGESYLEDAKSYYVILNNWIENYIKEENRPIILNIKLSYYNTSTSKSILELLYILKEYQDKGGDVSINWYYSEDDIEVNEEVEDFEIETGLKINLILDNSLEN